VSSALILVDIGARSAISTGIHSPEVDVSKLELDLMEYTHTRAAICESAISEVGRAGAHEAVAELRFIGAVRAIMDGQSLPGRGAE
jgi:hypothetical protein